MAEDPYRVLGVSKDSSDAEIKRTYRKLARQYHPDRNPNDTAAEERFKSIQTAYESIGSPEARREWDQQRRMEEMFRGGRSPSGSSRGFDFGDLFSQFVGGRSNANFGFDPKPFIFAVCYAASASFITPVGYQTNLMVFGPGGYRYSDYIKVGLPLGLILWIVSVIMIPMIWPF